MYIRSIAIIDDLIKDNHDDFVLPSKPLNLKGKLIHFVC